MSVYRARTDGFVVGVSVLVMALLGLAVTAGVLAAARRAGDPALGLGLGALSLLILVIPMGAWAYAPRAFCVDDGVLRIERPAGDITVPLTSITSVTALDAFVGLSWKTPPGGNSGLFGIYGTFYRRDLGKYRMYGRAASRTVLLQTGSGKIVVTPERRDAFIAELSQELSS